MDDSAFQTLADRLLARLYATLDAAMADDLDVDLRAGILTLEFDDGRQYVINKHGPTHQVWLSSPVSGAAHFQFDEPTASWRSTRGGGTLTDILASEMAAATGRELRFD